jgi:hypothetical protein
VSAFDLSVKISAGVAESGGKVRTFDTSLPGLVSSHWPDLQYPQQLVIIPREDFDAILVATRGRPILAVRDAALVTLDRTKVPRKSAIRRALAWWFA